MIIKLIDKDTDDIEVTVVGRASSNNVQHIVDVLNGSNSVTKILAMYDNKELVLNVSDIQYFVVEDRRVYAVAKQHKLATRYTLQHIVSLMSGKGMVQVNKSTIINIHKLRWMEAEFSGNYTLQLDGGSKIIASRHYINGLKKAIKEI